MKNLSISTSLAGEFNARVEVSILEQQVYTVLTKKLGDDGKIGDWTRNTFESIQNSSITDNREYTLNSPKSPHHRNDELENI